MRKTSKVKTVYQTVEQYIADDGTVFESEDECKAYEATFNSNLESAFINIERHDIDLPFSGWDCEPDLSAIFILKSEDDYNALRTWMEIREDVTDWYGRDPGQYPAVYLVIGRDNFNVGYQLSKNAVDGLRKSANTINALLKKVETK